MSFVVQCACGKRLRAKEGPAGKRVRRPACNRSLTVPPPLPAVCAAVSPRPAFLAEPRNAPALDGKAPWGKRLPWFAAAGLALLVVGALAATAVLAAFMGLRQRPAQSAPVASTPTLEPAPRPVSSPPPPPPAQPPDLVPRPPPPIRPGPPSTPSIAELLLGIWVSCEDGPRGVLRSTTTFHSDGAYITNSPFSQVGGIDFSNSGNWSVKDGRLVMRVEATTDRFVLPLYTTVSNEIIRV